MKKDQVQIEKMDKDFEQSHTDIQITDESKNPEKQQKEKLIDHKTKKQKYRENNFVVGAGHAFFISDAQENYEDDSKSTKNEKIGGNAFPFNNQNNNNSEKELEMGNIHKNSGLDNSTDAHDSQRERSNSLEHSVDHGRLSLVVKGSKMPKFVPWVLLVFSVILGASIPTWILHYPAKKYLRICWRYFMTSFMLIPLIFWERRQPQFKNLYSRENIFNLRHMRKIFLSSLGSSLWFGFLLFSFDYTSVSHAILMGNLQNFFLSLWRIYFKRQKSLEIEVVGQVLILIGISLIISDSVTMDDLQSVDRDKFVMTTYLDRVWWKRICLGDLICILVSILMCKFSLIETEVKSIYPPYLSIFISCVFCTFLMILISWFVEITGISTEGVTGWTDLFQLENFLSYMLLSFFCGLGLFLSYMYVGKHFTPIVSASIFLFEPIVATILIFIFSVQMLPGPFACLGYVFMIPGMFLILLTRHILSLQQKKNRQSHDTSDSK